MKILLLVVIVIASVIIPVACCVVNSTPEDRAQDDKGYMEWLKECKERKKVHQ